MIYIYIYIYIYICIFCVFLDSFVFIFMFMFIFVCMFTYCSIDSELAKRGVCCACISLPSLGAAPSQGFPHVAPRNSN